MKEQFSIKTKVLTEDHSMKMLAEVKGTHALIISDKVMEKLGCLTEAADLLKKAGLTVTVFTGVTSDPGTDVVAAGMKALLESRADVVVALGGGSVIDTAKGVLYSTYRYTEGNKEKFIKPYFIAIPSTSGTGSEVTNFSVITAGGTKMVIVDDYIAPDLAILDSTCIQHVPQHVIADTGMDVLTHGVESFVSKKSSDFTEAMAEKAVQLVFKYLERVYNDPTDTEARDHVQSASCMAGMAFTNSNLGIAHSLAHALGEKFHIPHGRACSLVLENVIRYNAEIDGHADNWASKRYALLASSLGLPARTPREGTINLIIKIDRLEKKLNIEPGIHQLEKVDPAEFKENLENLADTALKDRCMPANPRTPTKEDLIGIYRKSF